MLRLLSPNSSLNFFDISASKFRKTLFLVPAFVLLAFVSQAQVKLAGWDFSTLSGGSNDFGPSPYAATNTDPNVTVGGLTRGSGVSTTGSSAANAWGGNNLQETSLADAVSNNDFATFTIQANTGYVVSFTSIDAYNIRRSGTGPTTGQWQYQVGAGPFTNIGSPITWGGNTSSSGNPQSSINLSVITDLQNVPAGTVVTFRVVTWGGTSPGGTWYLNDPADTSPDDFVVNGIVCTPSVTNINTNKTYCTIQAAIDDVATLSGHTIEVGPGTYNENVLINKNGLTLRSTGGKAVTIIQGTYPGGNNATVAISSGVNGVKLGQSGKGFTIIGFDGTGIVEAAAVYLLGAHTNITIEGNEIRAQGDHGLLSNFNAAIDGILINDNMFTGQTFVGAEPGGCGFTTQFDPGNNVPRQLVTMGGGASVTNSKNVTFINNIVTGVAGGYNSVDNCEQGNQLVTIDVIGAEIHNNVFDGTTTGSAVSLRVRGQQTSISCNTFSANNLGANCAHIFFGSSAPLSGASPSTLSGVASDNAYPEGGAYLTPDNAASWIIYRDVAQAAAAATFIGAGQTANSAASALSCPVTNTNTNNEFCSIQDAIDASMTQSGHVLAIPTCTYTEDVDAVTGGKDITLAPGSSPGCVTITGNMTLNSGDVLDIEIDGTTPCTDHDQFIVNGVVTLGGAMLNLTITHTFTYSDEIVLISSTNPISGTFAQGSTVLVGSTLYKITYTGNQVKLSLACGNVCAAPVTFTGNVTISTQTQLNAFVAPGGCKYTHITGNLILDGNGNSAAGTDSPGPDPITDLCNLQELLSVDGSLVIRDFNVAGNPTNLNDLAKLETVGNNLTIGSGVNDNNSSFTGTLSLPALNQVTGTLTIRYNPTITDISIPTAFVSGSAAVSVQNNTGITGAITLGVTSTTGAVLINTNGTNVTAINMPNLQSVGSNLTLSNNSANQVDASLNFSSLISVGNNLGLNRTATGTLNMPSLSTVTGSISIDNNNNLTSIDIPGPFSGTTSSVSVEGTTGTGITSIDIGVKEITGSLAIQNNGTALTTLSLLELEKIGIHLDMSNNALNNVSATANVILPKLTETGGRFRLIRAVKSLTAPMLKDVGTDGALTDANRAFNFQNNAITDLDVTFPTLETVGGNLIVTNNTNLGQCCIIPCKLTIGGTSTVSGNTGNCATLAIATSSCTPSVSITGPSAVCFNGTVILNGNPMSSDPPLTHNWSITGGTGMATLVNNNDGTADFTGTAAGTVDIEYYAESDKGCISNTATFTLTVETPPTLTTCLDDFDLDTDSGMCTGDFTWTHPDVVGGGASCLPATLEVDYGLGGGFVVITPATSATQTFPLGSTTVKYRLKDVNGNIVDDCEWTVTVMDNQNPVISTCPVARTFTGCDESVITGPTYSTVLAASSYAEFSDASNMGMATDNCAIATVEYQDVSTGTCPIVVTRTWTVKDAASNSASCSQTITINAPAVSLTCPSSTTLTACQSQSAIDAAFASWLATATFSGGCNATMTNDAMTAPPACGGSTTVTWTVTSDCEAAVTCSATFTVPSCVFLSGNISTWYPPNDGVQDVTVNVTGDAVGSGTTDANGDYSVGVPGGSMFMITPVKSLNPTNGLNVADVLAIQKHVTVIDPFTSPFQWIGADVNHSNSVTSGDAAIVSQAIGGNPVALSYFNPKSWLFVDASWTPVTPPWGYPEKINVTITSGCESVGNDFIGVKKGDVVTAYADPLLKPDGSVRTVRFVTRDRMLKAGQTFDVDVQVSEFKDIAGLQFALRFDTEVLAFESLTSQGGFPLEASNFTYYKLDQGEIRAVWTSLTPRSVSARAISLRLRFTAKVDGVTLSQALGLAEDVLAPLAYEFDLTGHPVAWVYLPATSIARDAEGSGIAAGAGFTLVARPNPFTHTLIAGFELPEACEAQVRLLDMQGRVVAEQKAAFVEGYNEISFRESAEIPSGVYYCELTTPWGVATQKVVKANN